MPLFNSVDNIYYLVLGEGQDRHFFEERLQFSSVKERVYLLGSVEEVRPYYAAADLFVLLSYGEGFPNVLLEAWAMELPCIVSNAPPFPDIVSSTSTSIVPVDDNEKLDDYLKEGLKSKIELKSLGKKNRAHVESHYSWTTIALKYEKVFNKKDTYRGYKK